MMRKKESGLTLVEIVLAILAVAFLAMMIGNLPSIASSIGRSRHASIARDVVTRKMESLRRQTFENLSLGENNFTDADLASLSNYAAVYKVELCPGSVCTGSEEVKEVTVTVAWTEAGGSQSVALTTLVSPGGLGQ